MKKSKKVTTYLFSLIFIALIIILFFYLFNLQKEDKLKEASMENLTELQQILAMDLDKEYPKTPRDVAKLHGDMTRLLYSGLEDEETKDLAKMIRELCDEELLINNPEEQYLNDLYTDISLWTSLDRKIENVFIVDQDKENTKVVDGVEHATVFISFTIVEKGKTSELRQYVLRKNEDNKWRILGWNYILQD